MGGELCWSTQLQVFSPFSGDFMFALIIWTRWLWFEDEISIILVGKKMGKLHYPRMPMDDTKLWKFLFVFHSFFYTYLWCMLTCLLISQLYTFLETTMVTLVLLPSFIKFFQDAKNHFASPGNLAITFLTFGKYLRLTLLIGISNSPCF